MSLKDSSKLACRRNRNLLDLYTFTAYLLLWLLVLVLLALFVLVRLFSCAVLYLLSRVLGLVVWLAWLSGVSWSWLSGSSGKFLF